MKVKQVIVVRKDLNMSTGKIAAQVAHAAIKVFLDRTVTWRPNAMPMGNYMIIEMTKEMKQWATESFIKVVVSCDSEKEIYELSKKADEAGIPYAIIVDNGFTEFQGNRTTTCIAIGPDDSEKIDKLTKEYKLL